MGHSLRKILGIHSVEKGSPAAWARALGPWLAPLLMVVCDSRTVFWLVAGLWMVLLIPGLLTLHWLFPSTHPLGRGVSRLGIGSILGLLLFGVISWTGCLLHWTLSSVLSIYAVSYALVVAGLAVALIRRPEPKATERVEPWPSFDGSLAIPRWGALAVLILIGVMFVGVSMASPPASSPPTTNIYTPAGRPGWWHGVALGFAASACCAGFLAFLTLRRRVQPAVGNPASIPPPSRKRGRARRGAKQQTSTRSARNRGGGILFTGMLWCAVAGLTLYLMLFTYSDAAPYSGGRSALPWNVDDVAYVSEAVDYQYGEPLGKYESSLGAGYSMSRSAMSPLMAPLVASIARFSGASCAALHHSIMPPLAMLISVSCCAAALMVILRMHRWLVPLGLLVILLLILKTWDYARCVVEMLAYRAMQPKALQLSWIQPLQLATLILLVVKPSRSHLAIAVMVALVGYAIHPFAAIVGVFGVAVLLAASVMGWRRSAGYLAILLGVYVGLGGLYQVVSRRPQENPMPPSGRSAGSAIQSRDLVRVDRYRFALDTELQPEVVKGVVTDRIRKAFAKHEIRLPASAPLEYHAAESSWLVSAGRIQYRIHERDGQLIVSEVRGQPAPRLDPFWSFGWNTLFLASSLAVPVLLVFGVRRHEILCVALLGLAVLLTGNIEPLGRLLNIALPTSIFWRLRWILPQLLTMACLAALVYTMWATLLRRSDRSASPGRSSLAGLLTLAMFAALVASTNSVCLKIAKPPRNLTKFADDTRELVQLLGGTRASPYVWGPFLVNHELPQLMPHVKLVKSRDKWTRSADHPAYRQIVQNAFLRLQRGGIREVDFKRLLQLYPIDHIVIGLRYRSAKKAVRILDAMGWRRSGQAGAYLLYTKPGNPSG